MSYNTDKNWYYELHGRYIHLWQLIDGGNIDTLGSYKIRLPAERIRPQLIYPNEDIASGLRIEYTSSTESEIFVAEAIETTTARYSASTIAFSDGGDTITDSTNPFVTAGFATDDRVIIIGSASNDGDYTVEVVAGTLTIGTGSTTLETAGESITIYQIPKTGATADETAHVNLNRMLSLAVVDFMKAMQKELQGDIQGKEYYMREFWKKVADDQSNKRNISISFPIPVYAVK